MPRPRSDGYSRIKTQHLNPRAAKAECNYVRFVHVSTTSVTGQIGDAYAGKNASRCSPETRAPPGLEHAPGGVVRRSVLRLPSPQGCLEHPLMKVCEFQDVRLPRRVALKRKLASKVVFDRCGRGRHSRRASSSW